MVKRLLLVMVLSILCLVGCKSLEYYKACKGDETCIAEMQKAENVTHNVVATATQSTGIGELVGTIAGGLAGLLVGVISGGKLVKKKGG